MTFQIFKLRVLAIALGLMATISVNAQESVPMQALIGQSLRSLQQPTPENFLNCIAQLKRIDAMFPDSIQPKYQSALQSLNFSVMNPHAEQTENLLEEIERLQKQLDIAVKALRGVRVWANTGNGGEQAVKKLCNEALKEIKELNK